MDRWAKSSVQARRNFLNAAKADAGEKKGLAGLPQAH
jgi:hypothetical protein